MQFTSPFFHSQRFALKGNAHIFARVVGLFCLCCPTAIIRRIALVIVLSVERMLACGRMPHIGKKVFKNLPTIADGNTTTSIIFIALATWVVTTGPHLCPYPKDVGSGHVVGSARRTPSVVASAAMDRLFRYAQIFAANNGDVSATAPAIPMSSTISIAGISNYCEFAKNLAVQIFEVGMRSLGLKVNFRGGNAFYSHSFILP